MGIIVQKYGGSSVADVEKLKIVAQQVVSTKRAGSDVVVVVSAMGKTTDELVALAHQVTSSPPQRELDMLVTTGERITMALLSMAIADLGEEAISFTGSQSGIITENSHQGARILEVRPYRLRDELSRGRIVIVAGYQGVSRSKEVTTLGRGGSDTSAVALAAALSADACEIYSDVDGVYSADPNICEQAQLLSSLDYETMEAMAGSGAKVLNAQAVEFARRANITLHARKTGDTSGRQTIVSDAVRMPRGVVAVVGALHVTQFKGSLRQTSELLARVVHLGGRVIAMHSDGMFNVLIDRSNIAGQDSAALHDLADEYELFSEDLSALTLVGGGLLNGEVLLEDVLRTLVQGNILSFEALGVDNALTIPVPEGQLDDAVKILHREFVE